MKSILTGGADDDARHGETDIAAFDLDGEIPVRFRTLNVKSGGIMKLIATLILNGLAFLLAAASVHAQKTENPPEIIATGGAFALEKSVTAGGGTPKLSAASLGENSTAGQALAGVRSNGGQFSLYSGFWTPDDLAPTAAQVVVGGRILTAFGQGIRNVRVTIAFPSGETRTTLSSSFGYYRFADIPAGDIYTISVAAKKYTFANPTQIRQVQDDLQDVDFTANE